MFLSNCTGNLHHTPFWNCQRTQSVSQRIAFLFEFVLGCFCFGLFWFFLVFSVLFLLLFICFGLLFVVVVVLYASVSCPCLSCLFRLYIPQVAGRSTTAYTVPSTAGSSFYWAVWTAMKQQVNNNNSLPHITVAEPHETKGQKLQWDKLAAGSLHCVPLPERWQPCLETSPLLPVPSL